MITVWGWLQRHACPYEHTGIPNSFTFAFDLLAEAARDWRPEPYRERRQQLADLFDGVAPPLQLMPNTTDQEVAMRWMNPTNAQVGIEGVVVKTADQPYRAGRTGDWLKRISLSPTGES